MHALLFYTRLVITHNGPTNIAYLLIRLTIDSNGTLRQPAVNFGPDFKKKV